MEPRQIDQALNKATLENSLQEQWLQSLTLEHSVSNSQRGRATMPALALANASHSLDCGLQKLKSLRDCQRMNHRPSGAFTN